MTQATSFTAHSAPAEPDLPETDGATPQTLAVSPKNTGQNYGLQMTVPQLEANYAEQLGTGQVTQEQVAKLTWLLTVAKNERLNLAQISEKIGYRHSTTLYRVFRGQYGADLRSVVEKIDTFKKIWEERLGISKVAFVETSLSRRIFDLCDLTRTYQVINEIYGDSQTGKSYALEEYRRQNNHGHTIYVRMPSAGHYFKFLQALCKALNVSPKGNSIALLSRILGALNENMLLLIDEIHQTCLPGSTFKLNTIESIRLDIYEAVHCGIVLCGTNVFRDEMEQGRNKAVLEQTRRRGMGTLQLPSMLPREDMDALAASIGLEPAPQPIHELRVRVIARHGLRAYMNLMRAGAKLAFNKGVKTEWAHFVSAHDALAKLSTKEAK